MPVPIELRAYLLAATATSANGQMRHACLEVESLNTMCGLRIVIHAVDIELKGGPRTIHEVDLVILRNESIVNHHGTEKAMLKGEVVVAVGVEMQRTRDEMTLEVQQLILLALALVCAQLSIEFGIR